MIEFVEIAIGAGGLPACGECAAPMPAAHRPASRIAEQVAAAVASWLPQAGPGPNIAFVGADAFAHPELPSLIRDAVVQGVRRVRLETGGAALSAGGNAAGAIHAGLRQVSVVVLGDAATHDRLTGEPGSFARVLAGVTAWRSAASDAGVTVATRASIPVCRHNLEALPTAVAEIGAVGVDAVRLDVSHAAAESVRAGSWLAAAADSGVVNGVWVWAVGARAGQLPELHLQAPETLIAEST